jgi:DNA-binding transcriptional LysR family regulator
MSRVTFAQLETFYWTVQLGSAQRAADHLNLAQPTVSLRLKELRSALGSELFEKSSRGLIVTAEGKAILPHISTILSEVSAVVEKSADQALIGKLRVGLAEGFAVNCLPPLLEALRSQHPHLQPEWNVSTSANLEAAILDDHLDMAVILNPVGHEKMTLQALGTQPTTWVIPSTWNLPEPITPKDLWLKPVVSNPAPSAMYRQVTGWFAADGLSPSQLSVCTSVGVIAELVTGGLGAAVLPVRMAERYVDQGRMRMISSIPPIENGRLYIAIRSGIQDAKVTAVSRLIRNVVEDLRYLGAKT